MYAQRDYSRNLRGRGRGRGGYRGTSRTYQGRPVEKVDTIYTPELAKHNLPVYIMTLKDNAAETDITEILAPMIPDKSNYKFRIIKKTDDSICCILIVRKSCMEKFEEKITELTNENIKITKMVLDSNAFPTKYNNDHSLKVMRSMNMSPLRSILVVKKIIQYFEDFGILCPEAPLENIKDRSADYISTANVNVTPYISNGVKKGDANFVTVNFNSDVGIVPIILFKYFCNSQYWTEYDRETQNIYRGQQMKTFWM